MNDRTSRPGGTFTLPGTDLVLSRIGYGAMQLAGPHVFGPPRDEDAAVAVLREAVALGITHVDTSDFYGPHVTNRIIRKALHPYPDDLTIVTKIGYRRGDDASWIPAASRDELRSAVHDNLTNLGLDAIDVVNLRLPGTEGPSDATPLESAVLEPLAVIADLKREGLVRHVGLSNATLAQYEAARAVVDVVCVQNQYNLAHRTDDAFLDRLAADGVAYVPFFPLGGFSPVQSSALDEVARELAATPMQVALAWLLHRSPNLLLIPGTSSVGHLRENVQAARITLPAAALARLDGIGRKDGKALN